MSGAELIALERSKHAGKSFDAEHDDGHTMGELAMAAACCVTPDQIFAREEDPGQPAMNGVATEIRFYDPWPADWEDYDPRAELGRAILTGDQSQALDARIRLLVIGGSLVAAEIDRLQRIRDANAPMSIEEQLKASALGRGLDHANAFQGGAE